MEVTHIIMPLAVSRNSWLRAFLSWCARGLLKVVLNAQKSVEVIIAKKLVKARIVLLLYYVVGML